jgi:hypothetical protein
MFEEIEPTPLQKSQMSSSMFISNVLSLFLNNIIEEFVDVGAI